MTSCGCNTEAIEFGMGTNPGEVVCQESVKNSIETGGYWWIPENQPPKGHCRN
jgi:hypothetical protein